MHHCHRCCSADAAGYIRIWTNGRDTDPWPSASDTSTALNNLRNYWNLNMQSEERTIVHMLSGMATGGGVAWVGQLCGWYSSKGGNWAYVSAIQLKPCLRSLCCCC